MTASVSRVGDFVAIVVDARDASNVSTALLATRFASSDDREAAQKLAELIETELSNGADQRKRNAKPAADSPLPPYDVLKQLLSTIEATGGLIAHGDGTLGCAGDPDWIDLADVALAAKRVLRSAGIRLPLTIDRSSAGSES